MKEPGNPEGGYIEGAETVKYYHSPELMETLAKKHGFEVFIGNWKDYLPEDKQKGNDIDQEANNAFKAGKYTYVIKLLSDEYKQDTTNYKYAEMVALSYLYRGNNYYKKTGNIKTFIGNIDNAKEYFTSNPSDSLKKEYSKTLYSLARAYIKTKPKNETEKDQLYHQAVLSLREALFQDSTNVYADSLLAKIKEGRFLGMIEKAKDLVNKGNRNNDVNAYFAAEYYIKHAAAFDPDNYEIRHLRSIINRKRLGILDYHEGLSFAITQYRHQRKHFAMHLGIKNYLKETIDIKLNNFQNTMILRKFFFCFN